MKNSPNYLLAIESSCDETSIALIQQPQDPKAQNFIQYLNQHQVISSIIASQAKKFAAFGGVIPEMSARGHAEHILTLFRLVLSEASQKLSLSFDTIFSHIHTIAVTTHPGLVSSLRVGHEFAKILTHHIANRGGSCTIHPINHLHGHIASAFFTPNPHYPTLSNTEVFPHLHLLVSGGNTQLLLMKNPTDFTVVGQTLDDAAGECLDKIGRMVGLDYPAGGTIASIVGKKVENSCNFPVGMKGKPGYNFSYSGLKTAVRYYITNHPNQEIEYEKRLSGADLATLLAHRPHTSRLQTIEKILISTQTVVTDQLLAQTKKAVEFYQPASLGLSGGVSANTRLREGLSQLHTRFLVAPIELSGDNAVMIGLAHASSEFTLCDN